MAFTQPRQVGCLTPAIFAVHQHRQIRSPRRRRQHFGRTGMHLFGKREAFWVVNGKCGHLQCSVEGLKWPKANQYSQQVQRVRGRAAGSASGVNAVVLRHLISRPKPAMGPLLRQMWKSTKSPRRGRVRGRGGAALRASAGTVVCPLAVIVDSVIRAPYFMKIVRVKCKVCKYASLCAPVSAHFSTPLCALPHRRRRRSLG